MILSKEKTPNYWEIVPLGDVCLKATKVKRKEVDIEKELIYLDIGSINNVTNRITEHKVYKWKDAPSRAQQIVQVGDILFSTVRVYLRNIAKIDNPLYENQICSSGFTVVRGNRGCCDPKYLFAVTLYEGFLQPLNELQTGTSYPAVRDSDVFSQLIPLPPLPEQRAIVSKIEQLFSELDNGISNLKLAQEQLKVYRQAVLKKAFEGELTKKWREQQTDLPDAGDLLEQIRKECEKTTKVSGTKIKTKSRTENELAQLTKVPKEWCWVKLEYIGEAIDPQPSHRTPKVFENGIPYVGVGDIDKEIGKFDFNNARKVSPTVLKEHLKRYSIDEGDFIIGKIGTIGKPFLIPIRRFYALSANVVLVKPSDNYCLKKYMFYLSKSQIIEKQFLQGSKATTQAAFGIQKVRILNIPLCSLSEQHVIVSEIETRLHWSSVRV